MTRTRTILTASATVLALVGAVTLAQDGRPSRPASNQQPDSRGRSREMSPGQWSPWCDPMMMNGRTMTPDQWRQWRQQMGMSDAAMMRCRMMVDAEISPMSPAGVLALRDELGLTDQQADQIRQIGEAARQQTIQALTDGQRAQLESVADQPGNMMQMCRQMTQRWHAALNDRGRQTMTGPFVCPWDAAMYDRRIQADRARPATDADEPGADRSAAPQVMSCCPLRRR